MKSAPLLFSVLALSLSNSLQSKEGEGVVYHYDQLSRYGKIDQKSPNDDYYDPISGLVNFSATDISIPGNSNLKVQLRRILEHGDQYTSNSVGGFGARVYDVDYAKFGIGDLEKPTLWSLDIPHIQGFTLAGKGIDNAWKSSWLTGDECSGDFPETLYDTNTYDPGGALLPVNYDEYWSGMTLHIPGEITEQILDAESDHPDYISGNKLRVTKSNWMYDKDDCFVRADQSSGENGGFKVKAPDGRIFTFGYKKDFYAERSIYGQQIKEFALKVRRVIYVTKVEDKFGNYVDYTYEGGQLKSIKSNDGREINLFYSTNSAGVKYLTSATANDRTWTYTSDGFGNLTKVKLPNNTYWNYSGSTIFEASYSPTSLPDVKGVCEVDTSSSRPLSTFKITDPDGLITEYKVGRTLMARYDVKTKTYQSGYTSNSSRFVNLNCTKNLALHEKYIYGPGLPSKTSSDALKWVYSYSENDGTYYSDSSTSATLKDLIDDYDSHVGNGIYIQDTGNLSSKLSSREKFKSTTIESPTLKTVHYVNRDSRSTHENQIVVTDYFKPNTSTLIKRVEYQYSQGVDVGNIIGSAGTAANTSAIAFRSNLHWQKIYQYTASGTWPKEYTTVNYYDDFYGAVEKTYEYNNFNSSGITKRYTKQTYIHDKEFGVINLPEKTSISSNDSSYTVIKAMEYMRLAGPGSNYPLTPWREYVTDTNLNWQKEFSYTSSGTLGSITFNEYLKNSNKTNASGKRYQKFSNYYRGIPRTVELPNRYSSSGSVSMSVTVDYFGNITSHTDLENKTVNYTFDKLDRIKTVNYAASDIADTKFVWSSNSSGPIRYSYRCTLNTSDNCTSSISLETNYMDALYRPYKIRNYEYVKGESKYSHFEYDQLGKPIFVSYPTTSSSKPTTGTYTDYDPLGRVISITQSSRGSKSYEYSSDSRVTVTDEVGNETTTLYQSYGQPNYGTNIKAIYAPEGVNTNISRNIFGNISYIRQSGSGADEYEYHAYDSYRRLCKVSRDDVGITVYSRNTTGSVAWKGVGYSHGSGNTGNCTNSTGSGGKITYLYDNFGNTWTESHSAYSSANLTYTYSNQGNLTKLVTGNNVTKNYTYTGDNWLNTEELYFDYTSWIFDYDYDKLGNLASLKYPNGHKIEYSPNGFGQPTEVTRTGFRYATNVQFRTNGMIDTFEYGNGITHKTYVGSNQLPSQMKDYRSGLTLFHQSYGYYDNQSIKYITDHQNSAYSITNMTYDGLDRLKSVTAGSGLGNSSLTYDGLGNIKTYSSKGRNLTYSYNSLNRLSKVTDSLGADPYPTVGYDSRGNILYGKSGHSGYTYNLNNQVISSGNNDYIYDGHKRRVKTIDSKGTTYYIYNKFGKLLYKQNNNKGQNYIYLGEKLIAQDGVAGTSSNRGRTHSRPFGEQIETTKNDVGYAGHNYDQDLGLNYMQARYFDPIIGRFTSNDPIGYEISNPIMSFNRFSYASNNPYKYLDPDGKKVTLVSRNLDIDYIGGKRRLNPT